MTDFVNDNLEYPLPFVLHDANQGGIVDSDDKFLIDIGLIPSAILTFAWHPNVAKEVELQLRQSGESPAYLKHDLLLPLQDATT